MYLLLSTLIIEKVSTRISYITTNAYFVIDSSQILYHLVGSRNWRDNSYKSEREKNGHSKYKSKANKQHGNILENKLTDIFDRWYIVRK